MPKQYKEEFKKQAVAYYEQCHGSVFGCEAFKYIVFKAENGNVIKPDNVHDESVVEIYNKSPFLAESKKLIRKYSSCAIGCENCPVQKYIKSQEVNKLVILSMTRQ